MPYTTVSDMLDLARERKLKLIREYFKSLDLLRLDHSTLDLANLEGIILPDFEIEYGYEDDVAIKGGSIRTAILPFLQLKEARIKGVTWDSVNAFGAEFAKAYITEKGRLVPVEELQEDRKIILANRNGGR